MKKLCEFKIFINKKDGLELVAEDVIEVHHKDRCYAFIDVLGIGVELENVLVKSISVKEEKIELIEHPLISNFLKLIQADLDKAKGFKDREEVVKLWEEFKVIGNKIFLG